VAYLRGLATNRPNGRGSAAHRKREGEGKGKGMTMSKQQKATNMLYFPFLFNSVCLSSPFIIPRCVHLSDWSGYFAPTVQTWCAAWSQQCINLRLRPPCLVTVRHISDLPSLRSGRCAPEVATTTHARPVSA